MLIVLRLVCYQVRMSFSHNGSFQSSYVEGSNESCFEEIGRLVVLLVLNLTRNMFERDVFLKNFKNGSMTHSKWCSQSSLNEGLAQWLVPSSSEVCLNALLQSLQKIAQKRLKSFWVVFLELIRKRINI